MKKLIAVLTAFAGALGLYAATTGTGFEIQLPDGASSTNYVDVLNDAADELGGGTSSLYWDLTGATLDENGLLVKAYGSETKYGGKQGEIGSDKFPAPNSSDNTNYLAISTSSGTAVTRYATSGGSSVAIDGSFYFDSLVKFTAFETNKSADVVLADGGKLAIWLQADEIDPETLEPTRTNLVVSAGYLTGGGLSAYSAVATNYLCSVRDVNVADGEWHRVSVKAIDTINSDETVPGFVIAIDGKLVTINTDLYPSFADIGAIDPAKIPQRVKKFYQTSNGSPKNNLFPSVFATSEGLNASITSVSFAGVGSVDDLVFTEDNDVDALEDAADTGILTVNFGSNIEAAKYSIGGADPVSIYNGDTIPYAGGTVEVTISDIEPATGYIVDGVAGEDGAAVADNGDGTYTVTVTADQKAIMISAAQAGAMVSGAAGDANKGYATAAEVFEAINDGTITPATLGGTITVTLNKGADESIALDAAGVSVVLDLAGQTITAPSAEENAAIYLANGSLTIIDSVGGGTVDGSEMDYPQALATDEGTSSLVISNGTFIGATYAGDADPWEISGGRFDVANNDLNDLDDATLPEGYEFAEGTGGDEGYYILQEIPPAPTTATVTFDLNGGEGSIDPVEVDIGDTVDAPSPAPTRTGYTFDGWMLNDVAFDFDTPIDEDITLVAAWEAIEYNVTYNLDLVGATNAVGNISVYTIETEEFTLLPAGCENYNFLGWTNSLGTVETIAGGATGDVTLYAKWEAVTPPVTPIPTDSGSATYDDAAAATAAANTINDNKTAYIEVPAEANVVDRETYNTYVAAVADGVNVTIEFTAAGEAVASNKAETAVMLLPVANVAAAASGTVNATITASQPGFYYSIMTNAQPTAFSSECEYGERKVGNGSSITLPVPKLGTKGFYKVKVSPRKVQ